MRSPEDALERLRAAAGTGIDDPRLVGVRLDLDDPASIASAARVIRDTVGAPEGLVHNAGVACVGSLEELPASAWQQVFSTNFFGPVELTKALVPEMRTAGRGRIVLVSSLGALRGMPGIGAYSAAKGALERWGESLSQEIAPFGLGVSVLVAGTFKTDILTLTRTYADPNGPYADLHNGLETSGRRFLRFAGAPERFAPAVERALEDHHPFARHGVGIDARLLLVANRMMPFGVLQRIMAQAIGIPRAGSLRGDPRGTATLTTHPDERKTIG
jgi:NAD(P)-dependent dehydrogenase (short-subunit alcohol dehydrogenase family)